MFEEYIERLVDCGYTEENAIQICRRYADKGDWIGMESFMRLNELLYNDIKQYPKEDDYGLEH